MSEAAHETPQAEDLWRALAEKAIGGDVGLLSHTSLDGIPIAPLYPRRGLDITQPWRPGTWAVTTRLDHPDPSTANALALLDLEGGTDSLTIVTPESGGSRGFGLSPDHLADALDGVELDFIGLRLDAGAGAPEAAAALATLVERRRLTSAALSVDLGYDPIGARAASGTPSEGDDLARVLEAAHRTGLAARAMLADGRPYHEAGAGEATELATVLATGVAYLRRLEATGMSLDESRDRLSFLLAFDADVFLGLAKARAMRRLWARVETVCRLVAKPIRLHAETSWRMMTRRDPWTNVMRTTAATFAAGVGGADTVTVLPFTLALGLPDAAARRLARNVQRVLIDEANLAKVEDAAAGSGGLEALTDGLCAQAWTLFQAIEAEGGIEASLDAGAIQGRIAAAARARARSVATLRTAIVGTSRFPSLDAPAPAVLEVKVRPGLSLGGLPSIRDAEAFEALRDAADAACRRPSIFLATLGEPAHFGARATYAANFFAAGGVSARVGQATRSHDELVAAFEADGANVACLCGTDRAYAEQATILAKALIAAGARRVFQAGSSKEAAAIPEVAAIIQDGCDALGIIRDALDAAIAG